MRAKIALAFGAFVIALLVAECAVRVAKLAPEVAVLDLGRYRLSANPAIGYEPVPGVKFEAKAPDSVLAGKTTPLDRTLAEARYINNLNFDYREQGNALGYRDYDHAIDKPPGRYRVVVLGDSIAAGLFTPDYAQTFPAALEGALKAAGKDAEVISFAVNGYNTGQEVATLLDRGLAYRPDVVVVAYCHNDRRQVDGGLMQKLLKLSGAKPPGSAFVGWLVRHSALARLLWFRLGRDQRPLPAIYHQLEKDTVEPSLYRLAELAAANRFSVALVVFPNFGYDMSKETKVMEELAGRLKFRFLDMLPKFQACQKTTGPQNIDRWHLLPAGNSCAGKAVAELVP